jgi:hypothetical protein
MSFTNDSGRSPKQGRAGGPVGGPRPTDIDLHQVPGNGTLIRGRRTRRRRRGSRGATCSGSHWLGPSRRRYAGSAVGRVRRVLGAHVELLAVVDAVVGELGAHTLPPAKVRRVALVDLRFRRFRQREELFELPKVVVQERVRHPMVGEVEEADAVAHGEQVVGDDLFVGGGTPLGEGERGDDGEHASILATGRAGTRKKADETLVTVATFGYGERTSSGGGDRSA